MGAPHQLRQLTMRSTVIFLVALATYAVAVPDTSVPEDVLVQFDVPSEDAYNNAKLELDQMRANGKDDKDCRKLADDIDADVKKTVKAEQDTLDALDKGQNCPKEGQSAVDSAKKAMEDANDAAKQAKDEYEAAMAADVDFGKMRFDTLTEGNCDSFFKSEEFVSAKNKASQAKTKKDNADGAAKQAKKDHEKAVEDAKAAENKCYCDVKELHEKTLNDLNNKVEKENKAWEKAANTRCVLDGTPADKCKVDPLPKVEAVKLTKEAEDAQCGGKPELFMKSNYNGAIVASYQYNGAAATLTWDLQHKICSDNGKQTPGSSNYLNKYCAYSPQDDFIVTSSCNWNSQGFSYVKGSMDSGVAYMCAHLHCDHQVRVNTAKQVQGLTGIKTLHPGDSVFCQG